ncbi:lysozyme 3-like [Sitodiplosis mosellana]|uniref:lysozyme 3-like n=1 Tax=Sitodiplosis mosellana TaxID=263140 RepID=UPI002443E7B8|nr:lysozyme 3-like [Sitodiplosis mosellana]
MNKLFVVSISCLIALFGVNLVIGQAQPPQQQGQDQPVTQTCLGCICEAISNCNRTAICNGDVCGLFRLTWGYWSDAGKPTIAGESPTAESAYANCANDPFCAASAVQGYMQRFGQDCNGDGRIDCYDHALIHYRGGYGCKGDLPEKYSGVFNQCLNNFLAGK